MSPAARKGRVVIHAALCTGCGLCVVACPAGCLELPYEVGPRGTFVPRFSSDGCRADGRCLRACPQIGAIELYRSLPSGLETR